MFKKCYCVVFSDVHLAMRASTATTVSQNHIKYSTTYSSSSPLTYKPLLLCDSGSAGSSGGLLCVRRDPTNTDPGFVHLLLLVSKNTTQCLCVS